MQHKRLRLLVPLILKLAKNGIFLFGVFWSTALSDNVHRLRDRTAHKNPTLPMLTDTDTEILRKPAKADWLVCY